MIVSLSDRVGHAFISIKQGVKVKTLGFYPISTLGSLGGSTPAVFGNDQNHEYDVSISAPISATVLTNIVNGLVDISEDNPVYNIHYGNCTDVAIIIGNAAGLNIPNCENPLPWDGQTPGTLGIVLSDMDTPVGGTKDTDGGNAPTNNPN